MGLMCTKIQAYRDIWVPSFLMYQLNPSLHCLVCH